MTFYDYDLIFRRDRCFHELRAAAKRLPNGGYCVVYPEGDGYVRKTNWLAKFSSGGIRYEYFRNLDDALISGIKWARRREREDAR